MTTRILSSRTLRLIVASLLVCATPFVPRTSLTVVLLLAAALMALAWFIVPGYRQWFVPASLVVCLVASFWPQLTLVRYQIGEHYLVVHRLTGRVDLMDARGRDGWLHPTPLPGPPGRHFERRPPPLAADTFVAAIPARGPMGSDPTRRAPDIELLPPAWPGQRVVSKDDTISVPRLPDGSCYWGGAALKLPQERGLAVTIGERHFKACRAVVYVITMPPAPRRVP